MRRLIGCLIFVLGVGGLGLWGLWDAAPRIQSTLAEQAKTVAAMAPLGVQAQVSGRDVSVTGRVTDPTELAVLEAAFAAIDGVRVVDVAGVTTLPVADPYELRLTYLQDVPPTLVGVAPSDAARDLLTDAAGADVDVNVTLAAGVPDGDWPSVAAGLIVAAQALQWGDVVVSGREVSVRGQVAQPDARDGIDAALAALPDGYTSRVDLTFEDDGTPLRLDLTLADGRVTGGGKLPAQMSVADIEETFGRGDPLDILQASIPAVDPDWPDAARAGMAALAALIDGRLTIDGSDITLMGAGSPEGVAQARAGMAQLGGRFDVTTELALWDDGAPFEFLMAWDGTAARAAGKYPADLVVSGPQDTAVSDRGQRSFIDDPTGAFAANVTAGIEALGMMQAGSLQVSADRIELAGTATSPQIGVAMDAALAAAVPDATIDRVLTYLDDGSPAAWTLRYDAATGAQVEGRLPTGLLVDDLAQVLGLGAVGGTPATALEDDDAGSSFETLTIAARYLPEVETLVFARDGAGSALDLVVSPGVDLDLVAVDLAENLPADVAFSIGPMAELPHAGTARVNAATEMAEVFSGGFWLPDLDFTTDVAGCGAASDNVLAGGRINFLSGSARLDATSIRAINGLAAVVRPCLEAGLLLEIGGHTDATGDAFSNDELSFDRAAAVRRELVARGALARTMAIEGYGQTQPIADNDTAEGRAANRRTTLTWTDP